LLRLVTDDGTEGMRFPARNDDEVIGLRRLWRCAGECNFATTLRHQMVDHDVLRLRHVFHAHFDASGFANTPRRGEFGV
jgi:hypothetical protein